MVLVSGLPNFVRRYLSTRSRSAATRRRSQTRQRWCSWTATRSTTSSQPEVTFFTECVRNPEWGNRTQLNKKDRKKNFFGTQFCCLDEKRPKLKNEFFYSGNRKKPAARLRKCKKCYNRNLVCYTIFALRVTLHPRYCIDCVEQLQLQPQKPPSTKKLQAKKFD